jgi:hypothetical protein
MTLPPEMFREIEKFVGRKLNGGIKKDNQIIFSLHKKKIINLRCIILEKKNHLYSIII